MTINTDDLKRQAAARAVDLITNGMVVGLGSGTTASYAIDILAERVANGLDIIAIPTSEQSRLQAIKTGIRLTSFAERPIIDLTIDGADQVETTSLNLIKGLGGALLREKLVACASKKLVIIIDERKLVKQLGQQSPLPVEIIPFAWEGTMARVVNFCSKATLRLNPDRKPTLTDSGHYILDCQIENLEDSAKLANNLKLITGVVETGLFINMTNLVIIASQKGIETLQKS